MNTEPFFSTNDVISDHIFDLTPAPPLASAPKQPSLLPDQKIAKTHSKKKTNEYLRKLNEENQKLKNLITELEKKVSTKELENQLLLNQLSFFKTQLPSDSRKDQSELEC